jgi:hypothetical protein
MNSSKAKSDLTLALRLRATPRSRLRRFLTELVNLGDGEKAVARFCSRFNDMLPEPANLVSTISQYAVRSNLPLPSGAQTRQMICKSWYRPLRNWIRSAWLARDERTKRWLLYPLLDTEMYVSKGRAPWLSTLCFLETPIDVSLGPPRPFEQALTYLLNSAKRTRHCKNPECPAPYFFADRRNQKYCSEDCALPEQRAFKRRWWQQNGKKWRENRDTRKEAKR